MTEPAYMKYAHDVLSGKIVAGELVKLACARFLRFLDDSRYEFRADVVDNVIRFVSHLRHFTGLHARRPFILEPWQQFAVANIFGLYKDDGTRLTRSAYVEIARKNGKTAWLSSIALYGLIADGEMNAEVDFAANSREQARIAFRMCSTFASRLNPSANKIKCYQNRIEYKPMLSNLNLFAADSTKLDGWNASIACVDEAHEASDGGRLMAVLESSQGMRENPLFAIITTAGFNKNGPCYERRTVCSEILHGVKEDDSQFALIYTLDEGDDWRDESVWQKANPNLGVTVRPAFLRQEVIKAKNNPSEEVNVKTKHFNIWCDAETVWIPDHYILNSTQKLDYKQFEGQDCYVGIDLASTGDLTAASFMVPGEEKYHFWTHYYLPEAALREGKNNIQYAEWRRRGQLTITPGNVTDYEYILSDLLKVNQTLRIQSVAYDPYNATQFVISATDAGLPMEPYAQNLGNFNRPTRELERLILSGRVVIDNNEITRYCFRNVMLRHDHNGNVKPSKEYESSGKKIDGVVSMLECLGSYLSSPRYGQFY